MPRMEHDLLNSGRIAAARQVMAVPEEGDMQEEDDPLYITWFAMAHAAVLLYPALASMKALSPTERGLSGGAILLVGIALSLLLGTSAIKRRV
jgi:hypothetical protein